MPNIDYYQVVFTIPDALSSLTLGNRREMFNLLFRSAWQSLKKTIEDGQQFDNGEPSLHAYRRIVFTVRK